MSGGSSVSTVSSVASAKGGSSGAQSRVLVRLKVGHTSEILSQPTAEGHTHRWTVFVRAPGPVQFTDRSLLKKVTFMLHLSFAQPKRVIKEPPFQVIETGYGGFTMPIMLQFSGVQKVYTINYDLSLSMDKYGEFAIEHKIELKNPPKEISELVQKYCFYKKDAVEKVIQKPIAIPEKRPPKSESKHKEPKSRSNEDPLKASAPKITISTPSASSSSASSAAVIVSGQKTSKSSGDKKHDPSKAKSEDRKLSTSSTAPKFEDTKDSVIAVKKEKLPQPENIVKSDELKKHEGEEKEKRHKEKKKKKDKDRDRSKERHKDKDKKKPREHSHSSGQPDQKHEPKPPQTPPPIVAAAPEDTNKLKRKREEEDESPSRHSPKKAAQIVKTEPNSPSRAPDHKKRPHSSMANAISLAPPFNVSPFGFSPATPCGSGLLNEQDEDSLPAAPPSKPLDTQQQQLEEMEEEEEPRPWSGASSPLRLDSRLQKLMDQLNDIRDSELLYLCADTLIEYDASVVNIDKHGRMDFDLCQVKIETVGILEQVFSTFYNNTSSKR